MAEADSPRFYSGEHEAIRAHLKQHGVAVVRGVVKPDVCKQVVQQTVKDLDALKSNWRAEGLPGTFGCNILSWGRLAVQPQFWDIRLLFAEFMAALMGWKHAITSVDNIKIAVAGRAPHKKSTLPAHIDVSRNSPEHRLFRSSGGYMTIQGQVCIVNEGKLKFCYGDLVSVDNLPDNKQKGFTPIPGAVCPKEIVLEQGDVLLWASNVIHTNDPNYAAYNPEHHVLGLRYLGVFACCANKEWQTEDQRKAKIARVEAGGTGTHNPVGITANGNGKKGLHMATSRIPGHTHYVKEALEPPKLRDEWLAIM